ncbi:hypothetical protein [Flavobacterium sp. 25HG05S-40]|uniref:hypothetical protein n=1 Tax=Flavobacterium sp. 25HG05S-40 TaxID=3458682 RepID=UPI0040441EDF
MKKYLFLFLIFFGLFFAKGQERQANLLLKSGKKVEGLGEVKKDKIYFRLDEDEKQEQWSNDDSKGIEFTGYRLPEKYIFVIHGKKNDTNVMEILLEGKVELYKYTYFISGFSIGLMPIGTGPSTPTSEKIIEYYIKKPIDKKGTKVTMDFKKIGQAFFSDCEDLMANINEEEFFEEEEIIDLVKFYNRNCGK